MIIEVGARIPFESAIGVNGRVYFYTGYEKSQNVIYSLFRNVEAALGDSEVIKKLTSRALHDIVTMNEDVPLEDNTQYWITRVV